MVAYSSAANGIHGEASECTGRETCPHVTATSNSASSKQNVLDIHHPNEDRLTGASNVAFYSMPSMHITEQEDSMEVKSIPNQYVFDYGKKVFSQSCLPIASGGSTGTFTNKDLFPFPHVEGYQKKYFDSYWSMEAVDEAIKVSLKSDLDVDHRLEYSTYVTREWKIVDSFVIFCFRKVMLLKLCFVSMLTIDLRFVNF